MTRGILSKLINEIEEDHAEDYAMVNVRPGEKVSAMLVILSKLSRKTPSALVTDEISVRLAKRAKSAPENAAAILNAVEETLKQDEDGRYRFQMRSALDILQQDGLIEVEGPMLKQIDAIFK